MIVAVTQGILGLQLCMEIQPGKMWQLRNYSALERKMIHELRLSEK